MSTPSDELFNPSEEHRTLRQNVADQQAIGIETRVVDREELREIAKGKTGEKQAAGDVEKRPWRP